MASLLPGFEYDIFISYRQKDNKYDGWVTEFVNNLRKELEATFKEEISVYFDINPHDGLLETHDVDASLKEKLKCLVFIPVISRTYCDPKSFAWEHEFKAFLQEASQDQFGLKVKLPGGNVASRVLPVRIHDLSPEDAKLCESFLGGILRGVDFIYKSPGVNRPLRSNEDHPPANQNNTYYRDQINKVANAINDILLSLKGNTSEISENSLEFSNNEFNKGTLLKGRVKKVFFNGNSKRRIAMLFLAVILLASAFIIYRSIYFKKTENTFTFIRLLNLNNDSLLINDAANFVESVNEKFNSIKGIKIIPILRDQYKETRQSLSDIRKDLHVNYILDGYIRSEGQNIKIMLELSAKTKRELVWTKVITWDRSQASHITLEAVKEIASMMKVEISPEELKLIETEPSTDPEINFNYTAANVKLKDAWSYVNYGHKLLDSTSFKTAIESYDNIIEADSLFALAYAMRAFASSWGFYLGQLDSSVIINCRKDIDKAISLNKDLPEIEVAQGFYYCYCEEQYEKALEHFEKASIKEPGNYKPLFYMSIVYKRMGNWDEWMKLTQKVTHFNPQEAIFLTNIGMAYSFFHKYDSALIYHQKAIDQIPGWPDSYKNKFETLVLKDGTGKKTHKLVESAIKRTGDNMIRIRVLLNMYDKKYSYAFELAERSSSDDFNFPGEKHLYLARLSTALNNQKKALQYYESARIILSQNLKSRPRDNVIHMALGMAYAGLGEKARAVEEGEMAIQIASEKNMLEEAYMRINLAQIYSMVGDYDNAFPIIAYLLNNYSLLSVKLLQLDPVWKSIMDHPEYKTRIRKYARKSII